MLYAVFAAGCGSEETGSADLPGALGYLPADAAARSPWKATRRLTGSVEASLDGIRGHARIDVPGGLD